MAKTKDELKKMSDETFYDNDTGGITPAGHREFNSELIEAVATKVQGDKADTAIQTATLNGAAVPKSGTVFQFPALATKAQGDKADTAIQTATLNGAAVPKSGTAFQFPALATKAQGDKADSAIQGATINGKALSKSGSNIIIPVSYTYVVDSDVTLLSWATNTAGNDYSIVLIKKGSYTLTRTINLTNTGTKRIYAEPDSLITINTTSNIQSFAFYYSQVPSSYNEYLISGVNICSETRHYGFSKCVNLTNCHFVSTKTSGQSEYGFDECKNLFRCSATRAGFSSNIINCGFQKCENLQHCSASTFQTGFINCVSLNGCQAEGCEDNFNLCNRLNDCKAINGKDGGYVNCNYLTNCHCEGTKSYGFSECYYLSICSDIASITGFYKCYYLNSCVSENSINNGFWQSKHLTACLSISSGSGSYHSCTNMINNKATDGGSASPYFNCRVIEGGNDAGETFEGGFNV